MKRGVDMSGKLDSAWLHTRLSAVRSNQSRLANALGRDRSAVSNLLSGKRRLKAHEIALVAQFLECSVADVMTWAGLDPVHGERGFGEMKQATFDAPAQENPGRKALPAKPKQHPLFGIWKGLVTLDPNYDYTQPADPDWGKVYDD